MTRARDDRKRNARLAFTLAKNPAYACPNCGEQGQHRMPPSLGERGFWACEQKAVYS